MFLDSLYNILTGNIRSKNYFELRKETIVKIFLHIASIILIFSAFLNFFVYGKMALAVADIFAFMISFFAIFMLKTAKSLQIAIAISSINLFLFFLIYIYINQNIDNGLIWTIFLPIFIIPLNGHNRGLIISSIFYIIAFIMAYFGIGVWENGEWNTHSYIRFVLASVVLVYIVYITELLIFRSNTMLYEKEKREKEYIAKLKANAERDYLTQIYNRRKISKLIFSEMYRSNRYNTHLCVAIADIDFFKKINDTYGHNSGDNVLIELSHILQTSLREVDFVGRWGGEEFILLFTHTKIGDAFLKCEQLCQTIREKDFSDVGHISCSIGVAEYKEGIKSIEGLVEMADKALYEAKESGRDKVVRYT